MIDQLPTIYNMYRFADPSEQAKIQQLLQSETSRVNLSQMTVKERVAFQNRLLDLMKIHDGEWAQARITH